ncbi:MAG: EamA family transporter [Flavobacteriaceae bacterium]
MDKNTKKWIYLFLLSGIWGSSYILIKKGLIGLSPIQLACFRIVITSFILVFFGLRHVKNLSRDQWKWLSVTGFFGTFFPTFLFAYSETKIDSSVVAVLNGLTPLFTLFIAVFFLVILLENFSF